MNYMENVIRILNVDVNEKFILKTIDNYTLDGTYYFNSNYDLIKQGDISGDNIAPYSDFIDILKGHYKIGIIPFMPKDGDTFYYPTNIRDVVREEKFDSNNVLHLAVRALGITYEKEAYARKNFPLDYNTLTGDDYFDYRER